MTEALIVIADRLVDGTGRDPVEDAAVVVEDGRITAAGPRSSVRLPEERRELEGQDLTVLPGFMDAHVHLGMEERVDLARMLMTPRALSLLFAVPNCARTLEAGVTTVRDAGLTPAAVRTAVERGFFPGPRMQVAVSILSQSGGHGDPLMPSGVELPWGSDVDIPDSVVDSPDEMRKRVRRVLAAGADWIKLCTSGGVLSPGDDPDTAQFTVEEIGVAVAEAAEQGRRVMAHAMSARGIRNALEAGVTSIEHGCFLDEAGIALMKERDAWLVPTLTAPLDVIAGAEANPGSLPEVMIEKARVTSRHHQEAVRAAIEAGANIAMGTDSAVGPHGANLRELPLMVECGMTPLQAIRASTQRVAELLRIDGDVGTIEAGRRADLVLMQGDPVNDVKRFDDPAAVVAVLKDGAVVRGAELVRA